MAARSDPWHGGGFWVLGEAWLADLSQPWWLALMFVWLFVAIPWAAIRVVHHAECLAVKRGSVLATIGLTAPAVLGRHAK